MAITKEQAIEWAGTKTADEITKLPLRADGRLRRDTCLSMLQVCTSVVHCFIEGGSDPPILPLHPAQILFRRWCDDLLTRNARKTQTLQGDSFVRSGLANRKAVDDSSFLRTFSRPRSASQMNHYPYLHVSRSSSIVGAFP